MLAAAWLMLAGCGEALTVELFVVGADGAETDTLSASEPFELRYRLHNTADEDLELVSQGCLTNNLEISGPDTGVSRSGLCAGPTTLTLAAGEALESPAFADDAGVFGLGAVSASLGFYPDGESQELIAVWDVVAD